MKLFRLSGSMYLFRESLKVLPAGTGSNARLMRAACPIMAPCTLFIDKAKGSHIWDVDRNEYIDYRLGYGPVILGHGYPDVHRATCRAEKEGVVYALGNELELELAKRIKKAVPGAEKMRFANSGTEATMAAIRIARGYTKKDKILKFEGHYHGWHDAVSWSYSHLLWEKPIGRLVPESWGISKSINQDVIVEEWNNFERIESTIKKHHSKLAAIILEPVMGNAAVIPPLPGFLKHLRKLCDKYGVLLIFDEVKTGFRLAMGGAQELFGVKPDLACYAKSLGNGYPIAVVAGRAGIMDVVGPGKVAHGGTYSSNPVSLAAGIMTLEILRRKKVFSHLESFGKKLMRGIGEILTDQKVSHIVQGYPAMFQFLFTKKSRIITYRELASCDMALFAKLHYELLQRGVMLDEDNEEPIFTCFSHSQEDLNHTLAALDESCNAIKKAPRSLLKQ